MGLPQIKFRKMTIEENIGIVKQAYFASDTSISVHSLTLEYFKELKDIDASLSIDEINKKIEEVVIRYYNDNIEKITSSVNKYNLLWQKYNDTYMKAISNYLNTPWDDNLIIDASIGIIPVFPRYLDTFSFAVSPYIDDKKLIATCAHETLHFIWFKKWHELYPNCLREEYDAPHISWQYSEMVTDAILNSKEINSILHIKERAYDSFYKLEDDGIKVMEILNQIYNENISVEDKIFKGYEYVTRLLTKK